MMPVIITSFSLGLLFGGVLTAAVSINELTRLREMLIAKNFEEHTEIIEEAKQ